MCLKSLKSLNSKNNICVNLFLQKLNPHPNHHQTMVIKMTDSSNKKTTSSNQQNQSQLRRTKMRPSQNYSLQNGSGTNKNTKAEFKRLKTILPSIKRKENVSKLDIILEAIKYIDDLQDQLFDRLSGTHSQREATLLALTEQDMERSRARLNQLRQSRSNSNSNNSDTSSDDEETIEDHEDLDKTNSSDQEDNNSHDSLEL